VDDEPGQVHSCVRGGLTLRDGLLDLRNSCFGIAARPPLVHLSGRRHNQAAYPVLAGDTERTEDQVRTILVVGGGHAGFYTAWKLERKLRRGEAQLVVVGPRPSKTYQPFLPEVLADYD
jgi:hypothetical protein